MKRTVLKHIKKKLTLLLLFYCSGTLYAQQLPHFSLYFLNDFLINPSIAGSKGYFEGKSTHRYQWEGITDAPRTYTLSVNGPIRFKNMGLGGTLFTDIAGPTRRTGFNLAYSYHLKINEALKLSLGLSAGLLQFTIDASRIGLKDENDDLLTGSIQSSLIPDVGFGLYLYHNDFYFGASIPQLLRSKVNFFEDIDNPQGRLAGHYFITAGYRYSITESFSLDPSILVKYVQPSPIQFEGTLRATYKRKLWLGITYRDKDAITTSVGYRIKQNFSVAYGYDFTTTNIRNYSSGTHEIMVGVRFHPKKDTDVEESD